MKHELSNMFYILMVLGIVTFLSVVPGCKEKSPNFAVGDCIFYDVFNEEWEYNSFFAYEIVKVGEKNYLTKDLQFAVLLSTDSFRWIDDNFEKVDCMELQKKVEDHKDQNG